MKTYKPIVVIKHACRIPVIGVTTVEDTFDNIECLYLVELESSVRSLALPGLPPRPPLPRGLEY